MKTLYAARHALPCKNYRGEDHGRILGDQGISDCDKVGKYLHQNEPPIDAIRTSTAARARKTAHILAGRLEFPVADIVESDDWYLAPANTWLNVVQQLPEDTNSAMIVGHNPGMCDFAKLIQSEAKYDLYPPLTIAVLQLDVEFWGETIWGCAKLTQYLRPDRIN